MAEKPEKIDWPSFRWLIFAVVVFVGSPLSPTSGQGPIVVSDGRVTNATKKIPVPAESAQDEAMKLIKEVYGDEWDAAKTPAQKSQ